MLEYKTKEQKKKFYNSTKWRTLRQSVLRRDNYECVWCKREGMVTTIKMGTLEVDHIIELEHGTTEDATDAGNLRSLCKYHHNVRHDRFDGQENTKEIKWDDEKW